MQHSFGTPETSVMAEALDPSFNQNEATAGTEQATLNPRFSAPNNDVESQPAINSPPVSSYDGMSSPDQPCSIASTALSENANPPNDSQPDYGEADQSSAVLPDPEDILPQRQERRSKLSKANATWFWEWCSITVSVISLIVVAVMLPLFNNKPLSRWPFAISPNTFISTCITIMKTSILLVVGEGVGQLKWLYFEKDSHAVNELEIFDRASRGPWGSLVLLFQVNRHALLPSLGAAITIAALALEPFGQQLISFDTRYVFPRYTSGSTYIAHSFDHGNSMSTPVRYTPTYDVPLSWNVDYPSLQFQTKVKSTLITGLFDYDTLVSNLYTCSQDLCTWPEHYSLGLCNTCTVDKYHHEPRCFMQFEDTTEEDGPESLEYCTATVIGDGPPETNCSIWPPLSSSTRRSVKITHIYNSSEGIVIKSTDSYQMGILDSPSNGRQQTYITSSFHLPPTLFLANSSISGANVSTLSVVIGKLHRPPRPTMFTPPSLDTCDSWFTEIHECHYNWCLNYYSNTTVRIHLTYTYESLLICKALERGRVGIPHHNQCPIILSIWWCHRRPICFFNIRP